MNIPRLSGMKVRYTGKNGYEYDHERARRARLVVGEIYTVEHMEIGRCHTDVYLEHVDGWFNSVIFDDVE